MAEQEQASHSNDAAWSLPLSLSAVPVAVPVPLPSRKRKARIAAATRDEDQDQDQDGSGMRDSRQEQTRHRVKLTRRQIGPCHSPSASSDIIALHPPSQPQPQPASSSSAATDEQLSTLPTSASSYFQLSSTSAASQSEVFHHRFLLWHVLDFVPLSTVVQLSLTCKYFLQCLNLVPGSLYSVHQLLQQFRPYLAHRSTVELSTAMTAKYMLHHQKKLIDFNDFVAAFVGCRTLHVTLPVASAANSVDECGRMGRRLLLGLAQMINNKLQHLVIENLALPDRYANTATSCYGVAPRLCASLESLTIRHSNIASHHWHHLFAVQTFDPLLHSSSDAEHSAYKYAWPRLSRVSLDHCAQLLDAHLSWLAPAHCPSLQHFAVPFAKMLSGKTVQRICQQYNSQLRTVNLRGVSVASSMLQQCASYTDHVTDLHLGDLYHAMDEPLLTVLTEQCHSTLTRLAVGSSGVRFQRLAERCHHLEALDVNCCMWFDDDSLEAVCKANQQLQSISMANCWRISNGGLERLAQLAPAAAADRDRDRDSHMLHSLHTVNLYSCSVGDAGMRSLASIPSVTSVDCGNCSTISDAGIRELAALTQLQHLSLENNIQISGTALPHVARGTPLMHSLSLARCSMLDEDSLLAALTSWRRIKWLDVSGCIKLTHSALHYIQHALPECKLVHTMVPAAVEHDMVSTSSCVSSGVPHSVPASAALRAVDSTSTSAGSDPIAQHWAKRRRTTTGPPSHCSPGSASSHTSHSRRSSRRSTAASRTHSLHMTSLLSDSDKNAPSTHYPLTQLPPVLPDSTSGPPMFLSVPQLTALMDPPPLAPSSAAVTVSPSIIRRIELPSAAARPVRIAFTAGGHPIV